MSDDEHTWRPRAGDRVVFRDPPTEEASTDVGTLGYYAPGMAKVLVSWDSGVTDKWEIAGLCPTGEAVCPLCRGSGWWRDGAGESVTCGRCGGGGLVPITGVRR